MYLQYVQLRLEDGVILTLSDLRLAFHVFSGQLVFTKLSSTLVLTLQNLRQLVAARLQAFLAGRSV